MRPVLTLPASPVSLVSLCLGPSGVAAARTVTPEMESHVKLFAGIHVGGTWSALYQTPVPAKAVTLDTAAT